MFTRQGFDLHEFITCKGRLFQHRCLEWVSIGHPHLLETIIKPSEKYVFYREPVKSEKHPNLNLETMLSFSLRPIMASWLGRSLRPRYIWTELVLSRQSVQFVLHRKLSETILRFSDCLKFRLIAHWKPVKVSDLTTPVCVFVTVGPALWKNSIFSTYFPSWNISLKVCLSRIFWILKFIILEMKSPWHPASQCSCDLPMHDSPRVCVGCQYAGVNES